METPYDQPNDWESLRLSAMLYIRHLQQVRKRYENDLSQIDSRNLARKWMHIDTIYEQWYHRIYSEELKNETLLFLCDHFEIVALLEENKNASA